MCIEFITLKSPVLQLSFEIHIIGSIRLPMGQYCGNQTSGTSIYNPFPESLIRFTVKFLYFT